MAEAFLPNMIGGAGSGSGLSFELIKTLSGSNGSISYTPDSTYAFLCFESYITGTWKFTSDYGSKCAFCLDWGTDTYNHTGALVTCIASNYTDYSTYFYFNSTTYLGTTLVMISESELAASASTSGTSASSISTRTAIASWNRSNYSSGGTFSVNGSNGSTATSTGSLKINIYGAKYTLP